MHSTLCVPRVQNHRQRAEHAQRTGMEVTAQRLQEILSEEDVEGLLALGAPADEYSGEAEAIAAAFQQVTAETPSELDVLSIVQAVWAHFFGPFSEEEMHSRLTSLGKVARRILENVADTQRPGDRRPGHPGPSSEPDSAP